MDILDKSKNDSREKLIKLKEEIESTFKEKNDFYENLCIYACGSLGRLEVMNDSDLDLFFILADKGDEAFKCSNLDKYDFFAKLHTINKNNNFKRPTKEGLYWEFISQKDLLDIGSRKEDYINSFTARMLLILESTPLYNDALYNTLIDKVLHKYFKDFDDHENNVGPML